MKRREMLHLVAGASLVPVFGCGSDDDGRRSSTPASVPCAPIAQETAGPFPGYGAGHPNVLALAGVVRSDIRSSIGSASGVAQGVKLTVRITVVGASCAPLGGAAVYIWQCTREGDYSMYSPAAQDENFLRGVQETGADGVATFTTVFPGCYPGRWPHIHFDVYPSLAKAMAAADKLATSQLAFPKDACDVAYREPGYEGSATAVASLTLASDGVFRDGASTQVATMSGTVASEYTASLRVSVAS